MRLLMSICFVSLTSLLSFAAMAQDKAVRSETHEAQEAENQPIKDKSKSSQDKSSQTNDPEDESFDLDSFFKQGEQNSKKGFGCQRPPKPIS